MYNASICTIGDEILIGQIVDTNSSMISRKLNCAGIQVTRMLSIGDNENEIISNLSNELKHNNIVIVTGGLGPTKDDITKQALAKLSGSKAWKMDERQSEIIIKILHTRGLEVLDINRNQALVPDRCEVIVNRLGTAPIMAFHFGEEQFGHIAALYSLPGVPFEAEGAIDEVVADICSHFDTGTISHRTVMTYGMAESALSKLIEPWESALPPQMHLAYLPNLQTGVRLRLSVFGGSETENEVLIGEQIDRLSSILGDTIYSYKDDTLENAIGEILTRSGKTLAAAESCTGGNIAAALTSVPGASAYFFGSVTSYDCSVKTGVLEVPQSILDTYGIVSSETAAAMAEGVRKFLHTDYSVSTTGLAGPSGDGSDTPVGTVWVGVCTPEGTMTRRFQYGNDRKRNIERFTSSALYTLLQALKN